MNTLTAVGRLTGAPVLEHVGDDKKVCKFSIACKRAGGKDEVDFIQVAVWFNAEQHERNLVKGQRIHITGTLKHERWERDGERRERYLLVANNTEWLDKPNGSSEPSADGQEESF